MQANYVQLCFFQPNVMKMRGGNCLFEDKTTMVLSLGQGAGQPHGAQPRVVEMSARGLLRTQNRAAGTTEGMAGSLLRDPGLPGSRPRGWLSPIPAGVPGALLISYSAFPCGEEDQKISSQP